MQLHISCAAERLFYLVKSPLFIVIEILILHSLICDCHFRKAEQTFFRDIAHLSRSAQFSQFSENEISGLDKSMYSYLDITVQKFYFCLKFLNKELSPSHYNKSTMEMITCY